MARSPLFCHQQQAARGAVQKPGSERHRNVHFHDHAASSCRDRLDQTPLHKSARNIAISLAPFSAQRMPCCLRRAPVT